MKERKVNEKSIALWWVRSDFRIEDNPALWHAAKSELPVLPFYIHDTSISKHLALGTSRRWWTAQALHLFREELKKELSLSLAEYEGDAFDVITCLIKESGARSIYFNKLYDAYHRSLEEKIKKWCDKKNIECHFFNGHLLCEPEEVKNKQGEHFKVFTPFWKTISQLSFRDPFKKPSSVIPCKKIPALSSFSFNFKKEKEPSCAAYWKVGEKEAWNRLSTFKEQLEGYADKRNIMSVDGTSRLSPYLAHGHISPIQIWHSVRKHPHSSVFLSEVGWREFSYHLLWHYPSMAQEPIKKEFSKFPWKFDVSSLNAWKEGKTGYPLVDAGIRQLLTTGWMHNRVRMIVASFLVKDLFIPWQEGETFFWEHLVDADPASNAASWQWVAGCGMDAAPYFRIFNPTLQAKEHDPRGEYLHMWLPELSLLPPPHIFTPWKTPTLLLKKAGVTLEKNYPSPLVQHEVARQKALSAYKHLK